MEPNKSGAIVYKQLTETLVHPLFISITPNLIMACFPLMKILAAKHVIEKALNDGVIRQDTIVVETSSGTYALGMALVCAQHQLKFKIYTDSCVDSALKTQMEMLGGEVHIVKGDPALSPQKVRLSNLKKFLSDNPNSFWPQQYDNKEHQIAYHAFGELLHNTIGNDFTLVGSVGSGSSTSGTIKFLRQKDPHIRLVGVDTFGSVLFGLPNGPRELRGLGNTLLPENLEHELFDQVHWLSAGNAFQSTQALYRRTGIFAGPTTGATYRVGRWIADNVPNRMVVCISADSGHRYQNSVYDNKWMQRKNYCARFLQSAPIKINDPLQAHPDWSYMEWSRRKLDEVSGTCQVLPSVLESTAPYRAEH